MAAKFKPVFYLIALCSVLVLGVLFVGAFNLIVNPYAIYRPGNYEQTDFFPAKPEIHNHVRMVKPHQLYYQKPSTVIIGSSRAQYGFDPARIKDAYNLAIPGTALKEMRHYIEFAASLPSTKRIIFAADFFMFNALYPVKPDFSEERLDHIRYADFKTLFSISTFGHSFQTLVGQSRGTAMEFDGLMKASEKDEANAKIGIRKAFLNNERSYLNTVYFPPPHERFSFQGAHGDYSFSEFDKILNICKKRDIELIVLIPAPHARQLILIQEAGLWPLYEEWKRRLVETNRARFALWDFSGFNFYSNEDLPEDGQAQMKYYWEASHFKPVLGALMIDTVLGQRSDPEFGIQLTSQNIQSWIEDTRRRKIDYINSHPDDVEDIREIVAKFKP